MVLVVLTNALLSALEGFRGVRAIEMPSKNYESTSTRENDIGILEENEDDASMSSSNPVFARRTNVLPL